MSFFICPEQPENRVFTYYTFITFAKYSLPYDIEFRPELPKTLVGKVAYRILEEEEMAKIKAEEEANAQASTTAE